MSVYIRLGRISSDKLSNIRLFLDRLCYVWWGRFISG